MKFTIPPNKNYRKDIEIICNTLISRENISISKFCDGEWAVMNNDKLDNKEFWFNPDNLMDQGKRKQLINAFQFKHPQYFVGVTCVKVFGLDTHRKMKQLSGQSEDHLTWADIWVNSNYPFYVENIIPLFKERDIVLFCNENGRVENLPFIPKNIFTVSNNAWQDSYHVIDMAKKYITDNNINNYVFLFCCGPFGNILCHQLTEFNSNNTYLDIGSTLNPWLQSEGFKRDYYMGQNFFSQLSGVWDQ